MNDWEVAVTVTNIHRMGDDQSIDRITVEVERTRRSHTSYSCITYKLTYEVRDDGRATLREVEDTSTNSLPNVSVGHLAAMLPVVERVIDAVPDVERVEMLAETFTRRAEGEGR